MKVKDLIEKLQKADPEATVIIKSSNFELKGAEVPVSSVYGTKTGSKKIEGFVDYFDGESYSKETWSSFGGEESIVHIS